MCGFSSPDPGGVIITWRVTTRSDNGIVSESNISASSIRNDNNDGLQWVLDLNSPSSSYLRVSPVYQTYDQSSYQCIILRSIGNNIVSDTGTLTVAGELCTCNYLHNQVILHGQSAGSISHLMF